MKNIHLATILAVSSLAAAQQTKTFKTSGYDSVGVSGSYTVVFVNGNEGNITATGDQKDLDNLIVETEDGKLKIYPDNKIKGGKKSVTVTVPVEAIEGVALSGSGSITSKDALKADEFNIALSGSGKIALNVNAKQLEAAMSGSGTIELSGNANKVESNLSGSGRIEAFDLKSATAEVNISGSGECELHCSEELTARISGSGRISYKGNPQKEDTKVVGSGRITKS